MLFLLGFLSSLLFYKRHGVGVGVSIPALASRLGQLLFLMWLAGIHAEPRVWTSLLSVMMILLLMTTLIP